MTRARREWDVPLLPTDEEMHDPGAYLRSVVRVFPDFAGTVLWYVDGPVDYDEARITPELAKAMDEWESAYYSGIDDDDERRSLDAEIHHHREGLRLGRLLSDELGDAFEVEVFAFDRQRGRYKRRILGQGDGTNRAAIAVFRARAAESEAEDARMQELRARGGSFGWTAYAPLQKDD